MPEVPPGGMLYFGMDELPNAWGLFIASEAVTATTIRIAREYAACMR